MKGAIPVLLEGYSMEMTGKDVVELESTAKLIPAGTRINITFLGNEDLELRVAAARRVKELGFTPVPHLSARRLRSKHQLEEYLARLQDAGASEHVVIVGGDPAKPDGPYPDSLSVIGTGLLPAFGVTEVSLAGYPEGHPDIPNGALAWHLREKFSALQAQRLGAAVLTQFAFDVNPVLTWIRALRDDGIRVPIRIGTPGPAGIRRLLTFARRFGVGANAMIVKKYGFSITNLLGTAGPDRFVDNLADELAESDAGAVSLHFYTFGGLRATAEWAQRSSRVTGLDREDTHS